jgi:hypothetical protein
VANLEIDKKITRKKRFQQWWKIEGKIECAVALVVLAILISYGSNPLVSAIVMCFVAMWSFGKMFFRKDLRLFLFIIGVFFLYKGLMGLLSYYGL